jgi:hypothetical protein
LLSRESIERYEEWDVIIPPLPSRSRLYRLEPIGIGTPYIESLTSYIARLAELHCVTTKNLVMKVLMPLQSQANSIQSHSFKRFISEAPSLNGSSLFARRLVEALQALTLCHNLSSMTMLVWSEVIATNKMVRRNKAWCPTCYGEWRQGHHALYEPLLWALNGVDVCPRHAQRLITTCPRCQKTLRFLTEIARPGYCSCCASWLGDDLRTRIVNSTSLDDECKKQLWLAESVGDLIAAASNLQVAPQKEQIAMMLGLCLDKYAQGHLYTLARLLKMLPQSLQGFLYKGCVPFFSTLMQLCYALSITPWQFLTENTLPSQRSPQFAIDQLSFVSRGRAQRLTQDDVQRLQQALEMILTEETHSPPSLHEIISRTGYHQGTILRHCPDLYRAISRRSRRRWIETENSILMKEALEDALASDEPLPLAVVARQIGCDQKVLRKHFPSLCQAIVTRYRQRFDIEQIRRRLQMALSSSDEILSLRELARQNGCTAEILQAKLPDLCKQIVVRNRAELKRRHEERIARICADIRQAMLTLHQQSMYPSISRTRELLKDPHTLREKEGHETWRVMLLELGYHRH